MSGFDVLIRGAKIVDGSGNPWFYGDLALAGDRIAALAPTGQLAPENAAEVVDASGMIVCPGFIDIQSHSIVPLMIDNRCLSKITQGVTTEIMGEGWTPAPFGGRLDEPIPHRIFTEQNPEWQERARGWTRFGDWLNAMVESGVAPNVGSFLGGGTLRQYARGMEMGRSDATALESMRRVMADAMDDGAFGVSYALIYPPDNFADTDEVIEVCKVAARRGGVYITHLRSEADRFLEGLQEAIDIGRRAEIAVEVYHLKAAGRNNWHKMPAAIEMIERARAEGLDITADMYPYTANGTGLSSILPPWLAADGKFFDNLADPAIRAQVREDVLNPDGSWEAMATWAGPEGVMPVGFERADLRKYNGMRLTDIAADWGKDWIDTACDLLVAEQQLIGTIYFSMSEENLALQLRQPWVKVSTDAGGLDPTWAAPNGPTHPRAYGTYTRVLGKYVRDDGVLTWEDAIRKMTWSVAERLGMRDRGLLRAGAFADVVVFNPATVGDRATFEDSHQLSLGIRDVWVNGTRVLRDGEHTRATPGRFVKGPGAA
jgi:N-acyl-D-aspartate/D-glutamate deacylase